MPKKLKNIVIVGLGLMGGSLAAAVRRHFPSAHVTGVSRNRAALKTALRKHWIHAAQPDLAKAASSADLIILCTPVDIFEKSLKVIDRHARPGTLVTDVGSVKGGFLKKLLTRKWRNLEYVSAHPMAGSHASGIKAVCPGLYDAGEIFLITSGRASLAAKQAVKAFWRKIMPRLTEMDAESHDRRVAQISHLPHALAACLVLAIEKGSLKHAASGFRDATRLALGPEDVWAPIFKANASNVLQSVMRLERQLAAFRKAMSAKDAKTLSHFLKEAARRRAEI